MSPILDSIGSVKGYGWGSFSLPPAFESIATATGTGSSNTITFSSIPSGFQHLQVRCITSSTVSGNFFVDLNMRFNSDTGSNYNQHWLYGDGSTLTADGQAATYCLIGSLGDVNTRAATIVDIHDYASTTKNKTVRSFNGVDRNGSGYVGLRSSLWRNTTAITSITIYSGDNFSTNNTFALYGIKGA